MALTERIGIDLGPHSDAPVLAADAAAAGARMARVRFALAGRPGVDDAFLAEARDTAAELRAAGLAIVAVVDGDLTVAPDGLGTFNEPGAGPALATAWADEFASGVGALAATLSDHVTAWEVLPGANVGVVPRIAPGRWWALLARAERAIKGAAPGAVVVAGALLSDDADDGVDYLRAALAAGAQAGSDDLPFDAIAVTLNVMPDGGPSEEVVGTALAERVHRLWRVLENREGTTAAGRRGVYVTGVSWDARRCGDDIQARNAWTALDTLTAEPLVRAVVWSAIADRDDAWIGLHRGPSPAEAERRPAWRAFYDFSVYARMISPPPAFTEESAVGVLAALIPTPTAPTDPTGDAAAGSTAGAEAPPGEFAMAADSDEGPPERRAVEPAAWVTAAGAAMAAAANEGPAPLPEAAETPGGRAILFHIPDAAEVLALHGLAGDDLAAALAAVTKKYGGHAWLPPGDYSVTVSERALGAETAAYTNQQVISALYRAGEGTWSLLERAGLELGSLAAARNARYAGPPPSQMAGLSAEERQRVAGELEALATTDAP